MVPAHSLDADHPVGRQIELRLVMDDGLFAGRGLTQLALRSPRPGATFISAAKNRYASRPDFFSE
jgi:hypothetical protein